MCTAGERCWYHRLPHNIKLSLLYTLLETASANIRVGDIFSAYIHLRTGSNAVVGYIQGVNGILQMVAALPAGVLADRFRRDRMLCIALGIGAAGGACLACALVYQLPIWSFYIAMGLLGSYKGFRDPPLESLYADSIVTGKRTLYTVKHVVMQLASCVGPLLSVVLFLHLGNTWNIADCRLVLLAGLVAMLIPLASICFFDDDKGLGHHSEAVISPLSCCCGPANPHLMVPLLLTFSDYIGALAAGMTIKFFSLFFIQKCSLGPVQVSLLSVVGPVGISLLSLLCQKVSKRLGRVQTSLATRLVDIGLLMTMAYLPTGVGRARNVLLAAHLTRMAFANCTRPLLRSVLMDNTPKRHRAKVNALDSVRAFSWSGSAAAGGALIERYGFQTTFLITAFMKCTAADSDMD
ncbi:hypothetical protein WJX72_007681 [[Myrmecia] bisecta]|uniref:Major facilitator superfamily (MFS) profile domain-containing protein n=1 Tax=[Myrmecia] bisecta TaxID=41462 RepID=A0AAW1QFV2_9CHLO